MISNILGFMILTLWFFIEAGIQWNEKYSTLVNLVFALLIFFTIGIIYWAPFWLFFMKG